MKLSTLTWAVVSLPAIGVFAACDARADESMLPWVTDPLGVKDTIAPYVSDKKLKPVSCPVLPSEEKHVFTMSEVVVFSLCRNPDTKAAYLSLLSQAATYGGAFSSYFPSVSADGSISRSKSFNPGLTSIGRSAGLSASMTLFDFGKREATIEAAEHTLIAAGYSYNSTLQGSIAAALQGYYQLLTSQNNVAAAEESEHFAKASFDAAKLKHDIGQVALADELQAKGAYSQAVLATQQAYNQLATDKAALARLMGLSPDDELTVAQLDDNTLTLEPFGGQLPQLLEQAKQKRVDLIAQRAQLESAKASLKATKRADLPSISASAGHSYSSFDFSKDAPRSNSIGVSVSIPIFTGFSQTYNERAAETAVKTQEETLVKTELDVAQDVWNAWHNYQTALQSWETSLDLLDSSTALKDVALGRYKEGIGTILDVLNAQSQYRSALQSQLQARFNLLTTRIDLVRAVGVLDMDTMRPEATVPLPAAPAATDEIPPVAEPLPEAQPLPEAKPLPETEFTPELAPLPFGGMMLDAPPPIENNNETP